jgi:hypothetical protein
VPPKLHGGVPCLSSPTGCLFPWQMPNLYCRFHRLGDLFRLAHAVTRMGRAGLLCLPGDFKFGLTNRDRISAAGCGVSFIFAGPGCFQPWHPSLQGGCGYCSPSLPFRFSVFTILLPGSHRCQGSPRAAFGRHWRLPHEQGALEPGCCKRQHRRGRDTVDDRHVLRPGAQGNPEKGTHRA